MAHVQSGTTRAIWMFLLREGGRWTAADIADEVDDTTLAVQRLLATMVDGGYVRRYERDETAYLLTYGITAACKVPTGVTLSELAGCGAVQMEAA